MEGGREFGEWKEDEEIEQLLEDFKAIRKARVSSEYRAQCLAELNALITEAEIRNSIETFKKDSAAYDDEFRVQSMMIISLC